MYECGFDQNRQFFVLAMQELFERAHAFHHFLRWWWDKCCVSGPRASDPVLAFAEFTRTLLTAAPLGCRRRRKTRSEEHTSELQSRENLVCRLLLEKNR